MHVTTVWTQVEDRVAGDLPGTVPGDVATAVGDLATAVTEEMGAPASLAGGKGPPPNSTSWPGPGTTTPVWSARPGVPRDTAKRPTPS